MLAAIFLGFNFGGFFFCFWFRLFFQVSTLATILSKKHFFSMAAIFLTSIIGYSNPHQNFGLNYNLNQLM
jgi:hypothetical protein